MLRSRVASIRPLVQSPYSNLFKNQAPIVKSTTRCLSTKPNPDPNRGPRFRNFVAIGIISYVILAQVVEAVNKENPKPRSMSESEYQKQQMKLKRRKAFFSQDDKKVWFVKSDADEESLKNLKLDGFEVINPNDLIEAEKKDEESLFNALLNDPETKKLPIGLLVDLILKKLKSSESKEFIVINYPPDIKESVKFEEKVVTIKKLIHLKKSETEQEDDDVVKYYKTVGKVDEIKSTDDISSHLQ